jgi:HlyD family secretion protein
MTSKTAGAALMEQGKKKFKTGVKWLAWSGVLASVSAGGWLTYIQIKIDQQSRRRCL